MSLTTHPVIASMRDERDVEPPKVEVDALGVTVVEDGDVMEAEHVRSGVWECFCQDQRHRDIDRRELDYPSSYIKDGAHRVPVHVYSAVGPVIV